MKSVTKRRVLWGVAGLAVASLGTWGTLYATGEARASAPAEASKGAGADKGEKPAPPLKFTAEEVVRPESAAMPALIEFSGPLVAPGTAVVRSKANGILVQLNVAEGSRVKAGQTLGELDLEELRYRVAERQANVASARAQFEQAEKSFKANEDLARKNFIASTALDSFKANMEATRGQLMAAQAQLETAQVGLKQAHLVAPISGVVSKRYALPGEKLSPEQQLLSIVDLSTLELAGLVGTHDISRIQPGMQVQVNVEGDDTPVKAIVSRIAPAAEPGTRSIVVTLTLSNPGERYRAGQYAQAQLQLPDPKERLTLPTGAVTGTAGQQQVWLIEQGVLVRRSVTTGRSDHRSGRVEIVRGLGVKDLVLAARFDNLREGAKAEVQAPASSKLADAVASDVAVK